MSLIHVTIQSLFSCMLVAYTFFLKKKISDRIAMLWFYSEHFYHEDFDLVQFFLSALVLGWLCCC